MSQSMFVYMENHLLMLWQFANIPGVHDWHTYNCPDTPSRPMNNVHAITYRHKQQLVVWRVFSLNPTFFIIYYMKCLLIYVSVQYKPRRNILTWLWMDITYPFLLISLIKHYIRNIVVFEWIPCFLCQVYISPLRVGGKSFIVIQDAVPECHYLIVSRKKNQDSTWRPTDKISHSGNPEISKSSSYAVKIQICAEAHHHCWWSRYYAAAPWWGPGPPTHHQSCGGRVWVAPGLQCLALHCHTAAEWTRPGRSPPPKDYTVNKNVATSWSGVQHIYQFINLIQKYSNLKKKKNKRMMHLFNEHSSQTLFWKELLYKSLVKLPYLSIRTKK